MSGRRRPLHPVKAKDVIKALSKLGFPAMRTKGAHVFLEHADRCTTTVPVHVREEIDRRLLSKIAADIGIHAEEFMYTIDKG